MILNDVSPDAACYASLVRAQLARGDLEGAVQLLAQMQRQQIEPDRATFQVKWWMKSVKSVKSMVFFWWEPKNQP